MRSGDLSVMQLLSLTNETQKMTKIVPPEQLCLLLWTYDRQV